MDFKSITEKFLTLEKEFKLFEKKIGNINFWDLIRWQVHSEILQRKGLYGQAHTNLKQGHIYRIKYFLRVLKNTVLNNPFLSFRCDILFVGHPRRKRMQDGLWWDIYCDPVIEHLSNIYKCVLLESPYLNAHLTPSKTKNIKYLDLPVFLAGLLRRTKLIRFSLSKYEQNIIGEIQNIIEKNFNIHFDEFPVLLLNQLYFRKSIFSFYTWILKKSRPKIVVVICGYGNKIFIEACHKLSIPVVELQHGSSVGRYHIGYSFPKKHDNEIRFPDYLLTFGDFWKNRSEYPIGSEKIFSVGYPFFEIEVSKYKNIKKRHQIIFISQGTIGHTLSAFAVQLNSIKNFSYKIIYKLHPGEYSRWRKEYPWLVGSGIEVIEDDKKSLYCLLSESKIQIGVYSTAIYEGLGFGLKTFLINLPGIEYMHELIEYGAVTVVTNVSKLVEQLDKPTQNKVLSEFFLKNNSLENIKDCLRKIFDQTSLS